MARYKLSEDAQSDLKRIYAHGIIGFGIKKADKYFDALYEQFELITKTPYLFQEVHHIMPGIRRSVCGVDSIYYLIDEGVVEILMIKGRQEVSF